MKTRRATGLEIVVAVTVIAPYVLEVRFEDGVAKRVNVEPALRGPMLEPLRDPALFAQARVDPDAGTVVWPNGADLAPEFLFESGEDLTGVSD